MGCCPGTYDEKSKKTPEFRLLFQFPLLCTRVLHFERCMRLGTLKQFVGFPADRSRAGGATNFRGRPQMTRHDLELLDKQIRSTDTGPPEGLLSLTLTVVFFVGMAVGGLMFAYTDQPPLRLAANDIVTAQSSQPALPTAH
jgi:hypothetical protein